MIINNFRIISGSLEGKMIITRVSGISYEFKLSVDLKEKYISKTGMCHAISWSVGGKYAIGAITGKPKTQPKKRVTTLIVWDSIEEDYWIIPKGEEFELTSNITGLSVHPQLENIVACGGNNGLIYLINIETGVLLQSFRETGVWSHSSDINADVFECSFSPTGLEFVISTSVGSLSFYGSLPVEGFQACPVEQFFKNDYISEYDDSPIDTVKKVCNARLIEYPYQLPAPGISDPQFLERLNFFKKELETYLQLEVELTRNQLDTNEERKFVIEP